MRRNLPGWVRRKVNADRAKKAEKSGRPPYGPAILPRVLEEYLERKLDNWLWLKKEPKEALERVAQEEGAEFHTKPFKHQLVCFLIALWQKNFLFFLDMGAGKTKLVLDLVRHHKKSKKDFRCLVLVPAPVNTQSWMDEIEIHAPDLVGVQMIGAAMDRINMIDQEGDVWVMNYHGLMVFTTTVEGKRGPKSHAHQINPKWAQQFAELFDMVVFDESHKMLGNRDSLYYRMCKKIGKYIPRRLALTGTPFGKDPVRLWAQYDIVDHGETFGLLGVFRAAFYTAKAGFYGGVDWKFDEAKKERLHLITQNKSIRYEDWEWGDVPDLIKQKLRFKLPEEAEEYYRRYLDILRKAKGNVSEIENSFLRMRQIAAGFLNVRVEDEKSVIEFPYNPRLELLETVVDEMPGDRKMMIAHHFVRSGDYITQMLSRKKLKWSRLGGKSKDPVGQIRRFQEDDSYRFLVIQTESGGGSGLNPQKVCNYLTFYESPLNPSDRKQIFKRVSRTGQERKVHLVDIVCATKGSVDEGILASLESGENLFDSILRGRSKL